MELVGLTDIAERLKVSRQRVLQLRQREDFPEPVGEIATGAVWDMDQIRVWARSAVRPAGRPKADEVARTMGNRFVIEDVPIHAGPWAQVFRATDRRYNSPAAIKLLDLDRVNEDESRRFELGLRAIEGINHPNVLSISAQGLAPDGRKWVAMPLATGSLEDFAISVQRSPGATADLMRQLCAGLGSAHGEGVIHGDIKPHNVLRAEDGAWVLTDFCTPLAFADRAGFGARFGAPELEQPGAAPSIRSDIFSLGQLLDWLSPIGSPHRHIFQSAVSYSTDSDPTRRYGSVNEFAKAINDSLSATQEISFWADAQSAADDLQERARGAGTSPEDLYRILEWAERLDPRSDKDMQALTRVFPWLTDRAILTLTGQNLSLFEHVYSTFGSFVGSRVFLSEYGDRFAEFARRVVALTASEPVFATSVRYLAMLGFNNKQWSVRDILVELLTHLQDDSLSAAAVRSLATLDDSVFNWNLTEFAMRALPGSIREPLMDPRGALRTPSVEDVVASAPAIKPARPYRRTSG